MLLGPRVNIEAPNAEAWQRCFPDGLGASAFASPGFQRLMLREAHGDWVQRALSVEGSDLWLPVLGQRDRFGRWILRAHPVGYDLMPVQRARMSQAELDRWVRALCTPSIQHWVWWLPSWHTEGLRVEPLRTVTGEVEVGTHTTYVIRFEGDVEAHLAKHVSATMRRYVRRNEKHGVTVSARPSDAQIDAYIAVYDRSYRENGWVGEKFSRSFYYGAARDLGQGGELVVVLHEGEVIGGGVVVMDPTVVHYFQGAIDRRVKNVHPHVALYSYTLQRAAQRGISHIDLGGVNDGNDGLVQFKTSWGAKPVPSTMLTFSSGLRRTLGAVEQRLPRWVPRLSRWR